MVVDEISSMARAGVDLDSSRGGGRRTSRPLPRRCAPVSGLPGAVLSDQALASTRSLCMADARRVEPTDLAPVQRRTTER